MHSFCKTVTVAKPVSFNHHSVLCEAEPARHKKLYHMVIWQVDKANAADHGSPQVLEQLHCYAATQRNVYASLIHLTLSHAKGHLEIDGKEIRTTAH